MLRYYPSSKIKVNLITTGNELFLNGKSYSGRYYETYDGKYFSGANPIVGDNKRLYKLSDAIMSLGDVDPYEPIYDNLPSQAIQNIIKNYSVSKMSNNYPVSYFPRPTEEEYRKGYITRYFIKGINQNGYITEISPAEYANFQDGSVKYDVSFYITGKLNWKIIGPLNTIRISQYDIRMGIIDMNKSEVEKLNKTFLGITEYIGGRYEEFARPTR
jgi:hypothetical protein